jgi:hypothetical protein
MAPKISIDPAKEVISAAVSKKIEKNYLHF